MTSSINRLSFLGTQYSGFFYGKRVLLTGHTGFKGSWLALWLKRLGAEVTGIALPPSSHPNLYDLAHVGEGLDSLFCDLCQADTVAKIARKARPEIVMHLAAQPLVRKGYRQPVETFSTNIMGTVHLLDALRECDNLRVVLIVTTDKVYANYDWPFPYRETDRLGGNDPYSASKACVELVTSVYRTAFFRDHVAVATLRAGNVIGGGDWSEDRLIPDAVRAWQQGRPLEIRYPDAIRPWQHVLEPLAGYLVLAEKLWKHPEGAGAYNFGPQTGEPASVREVIEMARSVYRAGEVVWGVNHDGPVEAGYLALEIAKSRLFTGFSPKWSLDEAIARTMRWYRLSHQGKEASMLCEADITAYETT
jgi:CDP-glucose 4,6-dehydratase